MCKESLTPEISPDIKKQGLPGQLVFFVKNFLGNLFEIKEIAEGKKVKNETCTPQEKLKSSLNILNQLSNDEIECAYFVNVESLLGKRKVGYSDFNETEKKILVDYDEAIELLKEAEEMGDTYSICLLTFLKENEGFLGLIRRNERVSIGKQEALNWANMATPETIDDKEKGIYKYFSQIEDAANKGNQYAQYHIGVILLKQGNTDRGTTYLKKSFLQGNTESAFQLAKYYYNKGDNDYENFLRLALKNNNGDACNLAGEIFWRLGQTEKALYFFNFGNKKLKHKECYINYMLLNNDTEIRDEYFGKYITTSSKGGNCEGDFIASNKLWLLSYEKKYLRDAPKEKKQFCTTILKNILSKIEQKKVDNLPKIDDILNNIYVQRRLNLDKKEISLGVYNFDDKSIGIDTFLYFEGFRNTDPRISNYLKHVLCHEIIHKISRESGEKFSIPRFIDEGITTSVEEWIIEHPSFAYPKERRISDKLIEYSGVDKDKIFREFLKGNTWYIKSLLDKHLLEIIEFFSNEDEFGEIVAEMKSYSFSK